MFNVTSTSLEKEVQGTISAFTSTIDKLNKSAEKAKTEASSKRKQIEELTIEAKALDAIADKANSWANKIQNFFN